MSLFYRCLAIVTATAFAACAAALAAKPATAPATQTTRPAASRPRSPKTAGAIAYIKQTPLDSRMVSLSIELGESERRIPVLRMTPTTAAQLDAMVNALADNRFFDEASTSPNEARGIIVSLRGPVQLTQSFKMERKTIRRLDRLRQAMQGNVAQKMDAFMDTLKGDRERLCPPRIARATLRAKADLRATMGDSGVRLLRLAQEWGDLRKTLLDAGANAATLAGIDAADFADDMVLAVWGWDRYGEFAPGTVVTEGFDLSAEITATPATRPAGDKHVLSFILIAMDAMPQMTLRLDAGGSANSRPAEKRTILLGAEDGDICGGLTARLSLKDSRIKAGDEVLAKLELGIDGALPPAPAAALVWDAEWPHSSRQYGYEIVEPGGEVHVLGPSGLVRINDSRARLLAVTASQPYAMPGREEGSPWRCLNDYGLATKRPGIYTIRAFYSQRPVAGDLSGKPATAWGGVVYSNTVMFEVVAPPKPRGRDEGSGIRD